MRNLVVALAVAGSLITVIAGTGSAQEKPLHQQRTLRWTLAFDTKDGDEYARQLEALGAILAVPDKGNQYRIIHDLKQRPVKGELEDLSKLRRIFWMDDKPESIQRLAQALQLDPAPDHVIALFPEKVEQELLKKERAYRGLKEDDISETQFKIVRNYAVEVASQQAKDRGGAGQTALTRAAGQDTKASKLKELLKERLAALQEVASQTKAAARRDPSVSLAQVNQADRAVYQAELELCDTDKERAAVLEKMLSAAREWEKVVEEMVKAGLAAPRETLKAKAARLEVEIAWERAKVK
jgi:hypothetical protein